MDLDAVLARRPRIALVDEFAHTNVPGPRNEKRWQDVEELLDDPARPRWLITESGMGYRYQPSPDPDPAAG